MSRYADLVGLVNQAESLEWSALLYESFTSNRVGPEMFQRIYDDVLNLDVDRFAYIWGPHCVASSYDGSVPVRYLYFSARRAHERKRLAMLRLDAFLSATKGYEL